MRTATSEFGSAQITRITVSLLLTLLPLTTTAGEPPDWVHDALVVANPAAAVGGCEAGIYTPAVNGIRPWRQAMLRWLTGRHVMGNSSALVRQEGPDGGAGLSAIVDPRADYVLEVTVFMSAGREFGEAQDNNLQLLISVLDANDAPIVEESAKIERGKWTPNRLTFRNGNAREIKCVVRAKSPRQLPCVYYVDDFKLTRTDRWWSPENVFNSSRTAVRVRDERESLCRTLDPDVVSGHNGPYLNWDGFFTRRGISVGGGFWEQEYNHLATEDPVASRFLDDGVARDFDGKPITKHELWPGYHMCHNAPGWYAYYQQRLTRIAPEVQSITQDNICAPSFEQYGKGCFCRWCQEGFRKWLNERWSKDRLNAAGIGDVKSFDVAAYVRAAKPRIAKGSEAVLADPVLRELIQYHYNSQLGRWRDTVATVKKAAGHPIAVCGNQWGAWGQRPYCVALSQIGDVAAVEAGGRPVTPQNRTYDSLATKTAAAAGEYRRPVWLYLTSLFHASEAGRSRLRSTAAQVWADGGVPTPWATMPGASGWFYDTEAALCRFVQRHRELFARRERCANVGLVYSLPTHAWRNFRALSLSSRKYDSWFMTCARILEESRVPYEVNCWSHPLPGRDEVSLARLERYQVLVVPGVDCFTDAQRNAVRAFQARGGRVISITCPTSYDGDVVPRKQGDTLCASGNNLFEIDQALVAKVVLAATKPAEREAGNQADAELKSILSKALGSDRLLETDSSSQVWANLWLDDTRQVLSLHLVNGDIDLKADRLRPATSTRWRVRVPAGFKVEKAIVLTPDAPEKNEIVPLKVEVVDGWATVTVPSVESYTVVALYSGNALDTAKQLAAARRDLWRTDLLGKDAKPLRAELERTLTLSRAGSAEAEPTALELTRKTSALLKAAR